MRPKLNLNTDPEEFINFYWLKEELDEFCNLYNLPRSGSKGDLTNRIYEFLKTGRIINNHKIANHQKIANPISSKIVESITLESIIPAGYRNDERHRAFFKAEIGEYFKFNVPFMNWMKANAGKTYSEAVLEWKRIYKEKRNGVKSEISPQFEFNQYFRDFFKANPNSTREDALRCWKYKKSLPGHNRYEEGDLEFASEVKQ